MLHRALPLLLGPGTVAGLLAFSFLQDARPHAPFAVEPVRLSQTSPFATCVASTLSPPAYGNNYLNAEVEPRVAVNPRTIGTDHLNIVGVWQQDRWATGGARGLVAAYSRDGGATWGISPLPFSLCVHGGVGVEAASDPWISFGPDGTAYAAGL